MFHKRCDSRIAYLERLLDEERDINARLQEQILVLTEKPVIPVVGSRPANVYYMDDSRQIEMVEEGDVPT